jgi:hypothetical protein
MKLFLLENNTNENNIVDIIINNKNNDIYFINTNCNIEKILNILPSYFDNYADCNNNNNLLILYNTKIYKVIYRVISYDYIIIIIENILIIFILNDEINKKLIVIIKKLIKLVKLNKLFIFEIYINKITDILITYLNLINSNIKKIE